VAISFLLCHSITGFLREELSSSGARVSRSLTKEKERDAHCGHGDAEPFEEMLRWHIGHSKYRLNWYVSDLLRLICLGSRSEKQIQISVTGG
jgi:hypothetical protein